jgi:hypothetical protein
MGRLALMISLMALLLSGCGGLESTASTTTAEQERVGAPKTLESGRLYLRGPNGEIRVGDSQDTWEKVFPTPAGAYISTTLPSGFESPYRARTYENNKEGAGVLLYGERIALITLRNENLTAQQAEEIIQSYVNEFGPAAELSNVKISYWFWNKDSQRLMICQTPDPLNQDKWDLTIALGDTAPMDALRMSFVSAQDDEVIGLRLLNQQEEAKKQPKPENKAK